MKVQVLPLPIFQGIVIPVLLTLSPVWGAGKYGQGLTFNGTSNYVNIADHNDFTLDPSQRYTWSGMGKEYQLQRMEHSVEPEPKAELRFFYFDAHTTTGSRWWTRLANGISVYWWTGNNRLGAHSSDNVLTPGQWSYVAVTHDEDPNRRIIDLAFM